MLVSGVAGLWAGDIAAGSLELDDVVMAQADVQLHLLSANKSSTADQQAMIARDLRGLLHRTCLAVDQERS